MKIALIEPFFTGSHKTWAESLKERSRHEIEIFSLPGRYWKWRMHGGAVSLAKLFLEHSFDPDIILATDMLDLSVFLSLTRKKSKSIPAAIYFHENQLTYPWSKDDPDTILKRDNHYGFINFSSALAADTVFFNSHYHKESFLTTLPSFLEQFPDYNLKGSVEVIRQKSEVLYLGNDLKKLNQYGKPKNLDRPTLLWNHRWEYDKNPETFFNTLFRLKNAGISFYLILLGKSYKKIPPVFKEAMSRLSDEILHAGYTKSFEEYTKLLWQADFFPVTNFQDFFGASVVEAIYCNTYPLLPNRLAYPEHLPAHLHKKYLYQSDEHLYQQLTKLLTTSPTPIVEKECKIQLNRYDWEEIIEQYDEKLATLCKKYT